MKTYPKWFKQETVRGEQDAASFIGGYAPSERSPAAKREVEKADVGGVQAGADPRVSVATMWADRYPDMFVDANYKRSRTETRVVLTVVFLVMAAVAGMWFYWEKNSLPAGSDLIYNMGLAGGVLLLVAFTYALRKRLRIFRRSGDLVVWYYVHLVAGIVGPLLIIFHSAFALRAVNSTVALITMLSVVISGVFGRYIYTRIGYHLHRRLLAMRETEERLAENMKHYQAVSTGNLERNLARLTDAILNTRSAWLRFPFQLLALRIRAARCYVESSLELATMVKRRALTEGWNGAAMKGELAREKDRLREHVDALVAIGQFHFYERLLVGWRIFHIPMLFILFVSGLVHVLAVHMY
jgi:hypothetical protein